ncbi:MAG: methyl-accepting chemotaxis protein [Gammaproteobacteria bacterium]|nr:methyl-accepting chemotaxis protein [Gammaproteobacteria bacterium]MDJ0893151.1 methyl-accepting chemotaxis protein [Gammaproteobacteria bacterium]
MLSKLRIGHRLLLLIGVQAAVLLAMGLAALLFRGYATNTIVTLNQHVQDQVKLSHVTAAIRSDMLGTINGINRGTITWKQARQDLARANTEFNRAWSALGGQDPALQKGVIGFRQVFKDLGDILASENRAHLSLYVLNDLEPNIAPFVNVLAERVSRQHAQSEAAFQESVNEEQLMFLVAIAMFVVGTLLTAGLSFVIYRSIAAPVARIGFTVRQVVAGDHYARTGISGRDELSELAQAFDGLLEDKVASLVTAQEDGDRINESVIRLLEAVAQLSQRDLTVKVPVTEDITGPVADALNVLTDETSRVLQGVRQISHNVSEASNRVRSQSENVIKVAANEQAEIDKTADKLASASDAMMRIAKLAQACYAVADKAIKTTGKAHETVANTVVGISSTRDTIRETEKRIKRLGERSQEISGVVNLINSIAERTHILALNASMHAASAGEAGRGFAVVADEVQRLAENAREATAQIATLVSNIQTETADTVNTMNEAIRQVVEGSGLAEEAGEQMQATRKTTAELVEMVRTIAATSKAQAQGSTELRKHAGSIQQSSRDTAAQLTEQTQYTLQLVDAAQRLIESVKVFKLPEAESDTQTFEHAPVLDQVIDVPGGNDIAMANA